MQKQQLYFSPISDINIAPSGNKDKQHLGGFTTFESFKTDKNKLLQGKVVTIDDIFFCISHKYQKKASNQERY